MHVLQGKSDLREDAEMSFQDQARSRNGKRKSAHLQARAGDEVGRIDKGDRIPLSSVVTRLADGEELIGFAGKYDGCDITGLSAVVWKPKSNLQRK